MAPIKEVKTKAGKTLANSDRQLLETLAAFGASGTRSPELWQACDAWADRERMAALGEQVSTLIDQGLIDFNYDQLPPRLVITPDGRQAVKVSKPRAKRSG